ncbi:MAG: hypothetical protein LUB61_01650 [Eggerthellaceae bacterium]|nr:hypothetical protein [Eggerthellaceae bacterium]
MLTQMLSGNGPVTIDNPCEQGFADFAAGIPCMVVGLSLEPVTYIVDATTQSVDELVDGHLDHRLCAYNAIIEDGQQKFYEAAEALRKTAIELEETPPSNPELIIPMFCHTGFRMKVTLGNFTGKVTDIQVKIRLDDALFMHSLLPDQMGQLPKFISAEMMDNANETGLFKFDIDGCPPFERLGWHEPLEMEFILVMRVKYCWEHIDLPARSSLLFRKSNSVAFRYRDPIARHNFKKVHIIFPCYDWLPSE